ncbi:MAG: hypothetical protein GYA23_11290 [Methanomicrobiales archaeon]|nr:hypothetical protein [Methanomicrobiales archaeon]
MMKGVTTWIVVLAAILLFCSPVVSAWSVSEVVIEPSGSLTPGTAVTVSYKIQFTGSGDVTFPSSSDLKMSTDLDSAKWTYTLIKDGIEEPRPQESGKTLLLGGFELEYPSDIEEVVRVTMEGKAPAVTATSNKTIIDIVELDKNNRAVDSSRVTRTTLVINTADVIQAISAKRSDLQTFRTHIDEKAAIAIDTSGAEVKYNDAKSKIDAAAALPSTQYTTAFSYLSTATNLMADGEKALDKAWAESEVANAQIPIENVDKQIQWFKGNKSTAENPELAPIIAKREIAVSYVSTANDEIANGQYSQARTKAGDAFTKGNESYTEALALRKKLESSVGWIPNITLPKIPGFLPIIIVIVIIVLVAVGVIIYRKRSRWDELG